MMTWQAIESAPRDGENVLITDGGRIFLAYQMSPPGVWRSAWGGDNMTLTFAPTHWMPLPEPPT